MEMREYVEVSGQFWGMCLTESVFQSTKGSSAAH